MPSNARGHSSHLQKQYPKPQNPYPNKVRSQYASSQGTQNNQSMNDQSMSDVDMNSSFKSHVSSNPNDSFKNQRFPAAHASLNQT